MPAGWLMKGLAPVTRSQVVCSPDWCLIPSYPHTPLKCSYAVSFSQQLIPFPFPVTLSVFLPRGYPCYLGDSR